MNDLYRRFFVRRADEKHYVMVSKIFTVLLVIVAAVIRRCS